MFINLKSQTEMSGFYVVFDGSTNLETEGTRGISHLIEHLICRSFKDMRNDFLRDGIDWNATTSVNNVVFYFTGLESSLKKYRGKLLDRIYGFDIEKKDFETERAIVLKEYGDTFASQGARHMLNTYRRHLNSYLPIGSRKDLESLRWIDLLNTYEKNFMKPSKVISVSKSGKFKSSSIEFSDQPVMLSYAMADYQVDLEPTDKKSRKASVIMLSKLQTEDLDKVQALAMVLGKSLDSPLYHEVREKRQLCYSIDADVDRFNNQAILKIRTTTDAGQEDKVVKTIQGILRNPSKYITPDRVTLIKGSLESQQVKEEINRYRSVSKHFNPEGFDIYRDLKGITRKRMLETCDKVLGSGVLVSVDPGPTSTVG
jgi:predicted Zn-dependent peptidase